MTLSWHYAVSFVKRIYVLWTILLTTPVSMELAAQDWPAFRNLRYDEDYSFLEHDSTHNLYEQAKWNKISGIRLSAGGEFRTQCFHISNEDFGNSNEGSDGFLLSRFLGHIDMRAKRIRVFTQLQGSNAFLKQEVSPVDENQLDLHQLFVDCQIIGKPGLRMILRGGRQELLYGFQRLISVRDGPNYRQAFDGFKMELDLLPIDLDAFYTHYVSIRSGVFNDDISRRIKLWGIYNAVENIPVVKGLDIYYLGYQRQNANFENASGLETRHSIGIRLWGDSENVLHDIELVGQFGSVGKEAIRAWTASMDVAYRFSGIYLKPEFGLKTELISGDGHATDHILGTFNPMFPRGGYFGLAAQFGPGNIFDIHPSVQLTLLPALLINLDYDAFWRHSTSDGLYSVPGTLIYPAGSDRSRYIGDQLSIEIASEPSRFLSLSVEGKWFEAGRFLDQVSPGKNILFIMAGVRFRF